MEEFALGFVLGYRAEDESKSEGVALLVGKVWKVCGNRSKYHSGDKELVANLSNDARKGYAFGYNLRTYSVAYAICMTRWPTSTSRAKNFQAVESFVNKHNIVNPME